MGDRSGGNANIPTRYAYLFEAKGIGRYIFASGRLRDMIGASELVAALTSGSSALVRQILSRETRKTDDVCFSRCAGGAFCLHSDDQELLRRIADIWRLVVMSSRPGLEMTDAWGEGATDMDALRDAYRNIPGIRENGVSVVLPAGVPPAQTAPLTGLPATRVFHYASSADDADEFIADVMTEPQREAGDGVSGGMTEVARRFLPPDADRGLCFPRNLERTPNTDDNPSFPFLPEDSRIAMIHADLSGLGQIFRNVSEALESVTAVLEVSDAIEKAILQAVHKAASILTGRAVPRVEGDRQRVIPARPLILAGDDICLLVRADLAISYAGELLRAIEQETEACLQVLKTRYPELDVPIRLSACAGIAFTSPGRPFLASYTLAKSLCSFCKAYAKEHAVPYPSFLAFHVSTDALETEYRDAVLGRVLTTPQGVRLTACPYRVGAPAAVSLEDLCKLAEALAKMEGWHTLVAMRSKLFTNLEDALRLWLRWREVAAKRQSGELGAVDNALRSFGVVDPGKSPFDSAGRTALFDAMDLVSLVAA